MPARPLVMWWPPPFACLLVHNLLAALSCSARAFILHLICKTQMSAVGQNRLPMPVAEAGGCFAAALGAFVCVAR